MSNEKKQYRIAVIPGDGIGKEVAPEGLRVLEAAAQKHGVAVHFDHFDFASWDYYEKHGEMMPEDWKEKIGKHDAIYFGAVGGRMFPDTDREFVTQQTVMTRIGVDRILKFAFDLAQSRPKQHLTSATKSNGISITMPYWDERVE